MFSIKRVLALLLCSVMLFVPVAALAVGGDGTGGTQVVLNKETIDVFYETAPQGEPSETDLGPQSGWGTQIWLNGEPMNIQTEPVIKEGTAFVSVHDFCVCMGCSDVWENGGATVTYGNELYARFVPQKPYILANGRAIYMPEGSIYDEAGLFVTVKALAQVFNLSLTWDKANRRISLNSQGGVIESAESKYNSEDLYWLARIINAESRGEPLEGQIAVGNVVLNRVKSAQFPNSVKSVVFDRKNGTQFTPASNGSIYREPTEQATVAAKLCLEGANTCGNSLYFIATYVRSCWVSRNRALSVTIGRHNFYY